MIVNIVLAFVVGGLGFLVAKTVAARKIRKEASARITAERLDELSSAERFEPLFETPLELEESVQ